MQTAPVANAVPQYLGVLNLVAKAARQDRIAAARDAYYNMGTTIDADEYRHMSESSAFFALHALGITEENAATAMDRLDDLVRLASDNLYEELHGDQSLYRDVRRRNRGRKAGHATSAFQWDQWAVGGAEYTEDTPVAPLFNDAAPQEAVVRDQQLAALPALLADVLSTTDAKMLIDHYLMNRSYKELAAEIVERDEKLQRDPKGFDKAMQRVNVGLARARERAAKRLPRLYRALAEETE